MGLDTVELVMALEEQFGIELPDAALAAARTPGDIIDLIFNKVQSADASTCMNQRAFHALRRALIKCCGRKRAEITPNATLESLIPRQRRREDWERLGLELLVGPPESATKPGRGAAWPGLRRPGWLEGLLLGMTGAAGLAALLQWRSGWAGLGVAVVTLVIEWWLTMPWCREFRRELATVGQLARRLVAIAPRIFEPEGRRWRRADVAQVVRDITIEQLGLKPEQYREDARFVEDLGAG
jgi:acyl carrier protein